MRETTLTILLAYHKHIASFAILREVTGSRKCVKYRAPVAGKSYLSGIFHFSGHINLEIHKTDIHHRVLNIFAQPLYQVVTKLFGGHSGHMNGAEYGEVYITF